MQTTIHEKEIAFFQKLSSTWWDENGPFKILHLINPVRLTFIKNLTDQYFCELNASYTVLDVGCGGGILTEPLARQGFTVTGIDATAENIEAAKTHADIIDLPIKYYHSSVEKYAENKKQFDIITALEIIEHVADIPFFLKNCTDLLKPGGLLFISTLNRTAISFLGAIVGAEYILKWAAQGTHNWKQFIKPSELTQYGEKYDLKLLDLKGIEFKPIKQEWILSTKLDINYIACFRKES